MLGNCIWSRWFASPLTPLHLFFQRTKNISSFSSLTLQNCHVHTKRFRRCQNVPNDGDEELYNLLRNELNYYAKYRSNTQCFKIITRSHLIFPVKNFENLWIFAPKILYFFVIWIFAHKKYFFNFCNVWSFTKIAKKMLTKFDSVENFLKNETFRRDFQILCTVILQEMKYVCENMSLIYHAQLRFCLGIICAAQLNLFHSRFARKKSKWVSEFSNLFWYRKFPG